MGIPTILVGAGLKPALTAMVAVDSIAGRAGDRFTAQRSPGFSDYALKVSTMRRVASSTLARLLKAEMRK